MPLALWRIITGRHAIWSGEGARLHGARWNPPGFPAIYASQSFSGALLEVLVHANKKSPPSAARVVRAEAPDTISREIFPPHAFGGWDDLYDLTVPQDFGKAWLKERRSGLLIVPSVVTGGRDLNVVVNPDHPEASAIAVGPETPMRLDPRFFP